MRKVLVGILIFWMPLLANSGIAAPSVYGSTGLINSPTADVLQQGQYDLGYYDLKSHGVGVFDLGLASNLEMGVAGYNLAGNGQDTACVNAKYSLMSEGILTPGIAVGMEDIGNQEERSSYAVASKELPFGIRINAGVGNGRFDGVFAAFEKTLNPISVVSSKSNFLATTLIAEFAGRSMSYGARMSITSGLNVDAGWRNNMPYFGVSFTK